MKQNPKARTDFVDTVRLLLPDKPDLWFEDETAFWADPAPYLVWAQRGSRPVVPRLMTHEHVNVFGAVRPSDGRFFAFIASHGNGQMFQTFLDRMQNQIDPNKRTIMILDNARFHHMKTLKWGKIEPLFLLAYSPDLNPIETLWLVLKKRYFNQWIPSKKDPLDKRVAQAIDLFRNKPEVVQRTTAITIYL